ncbi:MAG: HigA family addiction module antidote protein [Pseudomonadales bacterium]|nr:HigA family addiction module antidote protein [Pseudomonadales bacterium]
MSYSIHDLDKIDFSDVADLEQPRLAPIHIGEYIEEELLIPLGITKYRLAKETGISASRVGEIVAGKRSVTADTALRLSRFFGISANFFLSWQAHYDLVIAQESLSDTLAHIKPYVYEAAS